MPGYILLKAIREVMRKDKETLYDNNYADNLHYGVERIVHMFESGPFLCGDIVHYSLRQWMVDKSAIYHCYGGNG